MKEPVLLIMAAGMGSRYGGLKQTDPVGSAGELIIDFSLYDAYRAGFKKAIFIIKREMEADIRRFVDGRAGRFMETEYVYQSLADIPESFAVPEGRVKPWGTCQAVLAARQLVNSPFAVINADDFYGPGAFRKMHEFLMSAEDGDKLSCCIIGYWLKNTLTEHGHVSRGVCEIAGESFLSSIVERTKVAWRGGKIMFTEDDEKTWVEIRGDAPVSMNFFGFSTGIMDELSGMFPLFLDKILKENPLSGEFFLPIAADYLIRQGRANFKVFMSEDKWYGVTYMEDKKSVAAALQSMKDAGLYPKAIWREE